jgi:hypothetical protein
MQDINNYWAYFFGFFWGDGCFKCGKGYSTPNIRIVKEDSDEIFPIFEKITHFRYKVTSLKDRRDQGGAYFSGNQELLRILLENDFMFKSEVSPSKILKIIPDNLKPYFWRGYIDADGCFSLKKRGTGGRFSLSGAYNQDWTDFILLLNELGIESYKLYRKKYENSKSSVIEFALRSDIIRLGEYIYGSEFDFGLKRKYMKYKAIIDSHSGFSSKWRGISFNKGENKWKSTHGKTFLGWWNSEEEAHQARLRFLSQTSSSRIQT